MDQEVERGGEVQCSPSGRVYWAVREREVGDGVVKVTIQIWVEPEDGAQK